jgi:uncharacterized caspase-like protein
VNLGEPRRWGFFVGANAYEHFRPLRYSAADAVDFGAALKDHLGFTPETTMLLSDMDGPEVDFKPTRNAMLHALAVLADSDSEYYVRHELTPIQEDDVFVFYFSGHGLRTSDGDELLLPVDASDRCPADTGVHLAEVTRQIANLPCAHKVLFIDACRSELEDEEGSRGLAAAPGIGERQVDRDGFATFYSCDPRDRSYEIGDEDIRHGSFTYCLLEAVTDPTISTLEQLNTYLASRVPKLNVDRGKRPQKPFFVPNPAEMNHLPLFAVPEVKTEWDLLIQKTTELHEKKAIPIEWWDKVTGALEDAKEGEGVNVETRKSILQWLIDGQLTFTEFERRWRRTEKTTRSLREVKPQVKPGEADLLPPDEENGSGRSEPSEG